MEGSLQVGKTRYTHYSIAYHLVWIPKYRRRVLVGEVQAETKRLIAECCERQGLTLLAVETDEDHIHVFVSAPPRFSPAMIANLLKGYTSRYLREKFPRLNKVCGKEHLWTQSYYVGTAGAVSAETIKRYILENQGK
jgi:putative transposase